MLRHRKALQEPGSSPAVSGKSAGGFVFLCANARSVHSGETLEVTCPTGDARLGLERYFGYYNHLRRNRNLGRKTPASVYGLELSETVQKALAPLARRDRIKTLVPRPTAGPVVVWGGPASRLRRMLQLRYASAPPQARCPCRRLHLIQGRKLSSAWGQAKIKRRAQMFPYSLPRLMHELKKLAESKNFMLMREFLALESLSHPPADTVLLRCDVERRPKHHLKLARTLAEFGIVTSMYFLTRSQSYNADIMKTIQDMGHEVGYHYECLDRTGGDFPKARELFLREVAQFRKDGIDIKSVCRHGESGLPIRGYSDGSDLFVQYPTLLSEAGLLGNVPKRASCKTP